MTKRFRLGADVREKDGRHVGKVIARFTDVYRVRWPNGWKSDLHVDDIEAATQSEGAS